ncbi:MAG: CHAT domain-containing protein [Ardenticatenaceae bacterium]|nr:CHAT domain-containing protein [Ardenticatenaceae bacterium]
MALRRIRKGLAPSRERIQAVGRVLFDALFPRRVFRAFERARSAVPESVNLRLKLIVRPPELGHPPWALLYDPDDERLLAARLTYPLVRFIESGTPVASRLAPRPLRVLYVPANPASTTQLDLATSEQAIREALGDQVEICAIRHTTPAALRQVPRERPGFHILHDGGHAAFDAREDAGTIYLNPATGSISPLDGELLATYLDGTPVRLVVLAACETAVDSQQKRFTGVAQQLMRASALPAVVAMQYETADAPAIAFNRGFYAPLVDGYPVDAAVVEARKAILESVGGEASAAFAAPDWSTPALFMRSKDGNILEPEVDPEADAGANKQTVVPRIDTGAGASVSSPVNTGGGDFVGRDKIVENVQAGGIRAGRTEADNVVSGVQIQGSNLRGGWQKVTRA